jgi:hypothetical protein
MHIQVNTDRNIHASDSLIAEVKSEIAGTLDVFRDRITRIEVHLSDQNADKGGADDKRCMLEARVEGRSPTAVTHLAGSVDEAVSGAADKLRRALETSFGKQRDRR